MKNTLILLAAMFALTNCSVESSQASSTNNESTVNIANVTILQPADYQNKIGATENAQLIDVRTPGEYSSGHLEGSTNINIGDRDFMDKMNKLDKNKPVFVYCAVGGRSGRAAGMLEEAGFTTVYDLRGGITNWVNAGLAVVK